MNKKIIIVIIILILIATTTSGCMTKKYVHETDSTEYIHLKYNDRFVVHQTNGFAGTWWTHNESLFLQSDSGHLIIMPAINNTYIDPDGERWVKK